MNKTLQYLKIFLSPMRITSHAYRRAILNRRKCQNRVD
jgi:hypothetical protein